MEELRKKEAYRLRVIEAARIRMDQAIQNGIRMSALEEQVRRRRSDRDSLPSQSHVNPAPQSLDEA